MAQFTRERPEVHERQPASRPTGSQLGRRASADLIAEVFNLFNRANYDVNFTADEQSEIPERADAHSAGHRAHVSNPNYKTYTATLPSREAQLGVRFTF